MISMLTENLTARRIALIAACLLAACGGPPMGPEEAIRQWVAQGEEAVEDKDRGALVDMVSPAYTDARGNTRDDLGNILRVYFLRQQKIALITRIEELTVYDDSAARVTLQVGMAGTKDNLLGLTADAYRFELELERDDDDWLLLSARWGQLGQRLR